MTARRILVVEDDPAVRQGLVDALRFDGCVVHEAPDFASAVRLGVLAEHDLVLLDLVLPGGDGLEALVRIRSARPSVPVIILTARGQEDDRVEGLRRGADDYVVKPFSIRELLARVDAVLRRSAERPSPVGHLEFAGGSCDLDAGEARLGDGRVHRLSQREVALLRYLAEARPRVVSRAELLERVWHVPARSVRTRTVDVHVARLREKLGDDAAAPRLIQTVHGRGYRFAAEGGEP